MKQNLITFSDEENDRMIFLISSKDIKKKTPHKPTITSVVRLAINELYDKVKNGK